MKFTRSIIALLASVAFACVSLAPPAMAQAVPNATAYSSGGSNLSFVGGKFIASNYSNWGAVAQVYTGNAATGSSSITVRGGYIVLSDGRRIVPFAVGVPFVVSDANSELITPTAVSGCYKSQGMNQDGVLVTCTITAVFANLHGGGAGLLSGTGGMAEAMLDAFNQGGGVVVVGPGYGLNTSCTNCYATFNAVMAAVLPYAGISVEDVRNGTPQYWNLTQGASTFLAVPTTLTSSTAVFSTTPAGLYTTAAAYYISVAYVDVAGQEGAISGSFSETPGTSLSSLAITAPTASAGAVGYTIYVSLTSGTYSLTYQVPLTSAICTLTKIETVTPACAVANTTYNQSAANAVITALTVATSPVGMQLGGVSGTLLTGNPNGRTTYGYAPSSHLANNGIPTISLPFTAGGIGSATPIAIGTVNLPGGVLDYVGKVIRVCGKYTNTDVDSASQIIDLYWDAAGSNSAGSPVAIAILSATGTGTAATYTGNFCEVFHASVASASVTGGSIFGDFSLLNYYLSATPAGLFTGGDTKTAATGSLNLAGGNGFSTRLSIVHNNTTGNNTPTLQNLTIEVL